MEGENLQGLWTGIISEINGNPNYSHLVPWVNRIVPEGINSNIIKFRFAVSGVESLFTDNLKADLQGIINNLSHNDLKISFSNEEEFAGITASNEKNFDNFYTNSENRLAIAAGRAICKRDQDISYNPLFIYAKPGLGKTHLLNAIAYSYKKLNPEKRVRFLSCEMFNNQFFTATREDRINIWRNINADTDIFILDNIQNLAQYPNALEEFYQLFEILHTSKKQIVISSSVAAKQLNGFSEQLISRLQWGLEISINNPETNTKEQIIREKLGKHSIEIDNSIITNMAISHNGSIRELEGALNTICSYSTLLDKKIDRNLINSVFNGNDTGGSPIMIEDILDIIADYYRVKKELLLSKSRIRSVAFPRQVGMYLAKSITGNSLEEIGRFFGGRDHSTVKHGCEKIKEMAANDHTFYVMLEQLKNRVNSLSAV